MTTRRALLIGSPGSVGAENYLKGVAVDVATYSAFFRSALGGAWHPTEIVVLQSPTEAQVARELVALRAVDYSIALFTGHGHHVERKGTQVELRPGVEMDSDLLKVGANRHTVILDCCRVVTRPMIAGRILEKVAKAARILDEKQCRDAFDKRVGQCAPAVVTLYSCRVGEVSQDSETEGGVYCSSLVQAAVDWGDASDIDTSTTIAWFSVVRAHATAVERVRKKTGSRQNPTSEYPKTEPFFPFAVMA